MKPRRPVTPEAALIRMETLCSRSERSEGEIRAKLRNLGLSSAQADSIVKSLLDRRFIDDRRFAGVFARSKLIYSGYGRYRINPALRAKGVAPDIIAEAIDALDSEAYNNKLEEIIERKARSLPETSDYESRNKIYRYAASRGFESDLIIAALKRVLRRLNSTP
ncbi:MAG: RecX family transcriptional regulator [Muribaculaceae bacterium]|nr:RecX family transcriptional regulator [Muribaculaceae bacterium]